MPRLHPDTLNYCSWGLGSGGHLTMESLKKQAGITMTHIPYKGSSPCVQDIMGGQVDAGFGDTSSTVELVKAGRVKALAHSSSGRLPSLPEVPSMTEAGYPFKNYSWYGIFAPAKTPPAIVARLNEQVLRALRPSPGPAHARAQLLGPAADHAPAIHPDPAPGPGRLEPAGQGNRRAARLARRPALPDAGKLGAVIAHQLNTFISIFVD
jgi:hypothetical protein